MNVPTHLDLACRILDAMGVEARTISRVEGGWDTLLFRVDTGADLSALRVFAADQTGDEARETAVMDLAARGGLPVPTVRAAGTYAGRPAMLMDWAPGAPLFHAVRTHPELAGELGMIFGATQARMHAMAVPEGRGPRHDWMRWKGGDEGGIRQQLLRLPLRTDALLHLDYHPLNVLTDGTAITAVLDWANAAVGDPRADIARTYVILLMAPLSGEMPANEARASRRTLIEGWWRGYTGHAGQPRHLAPFCAWAGRATLHDLEPQMAREGSWLTEEHLDRLRAWTARWQRRASMP